MTMVPRGMEELQLRLDNWPFEWHSLTSRLRNPGGYDSRRNIIRKLAKREPEPLSQEVHFLKDFRDEFPDDSTIVTHLSYCCSDENRIMSRLRHYLRSPELWPNLRSLRVFKLQGRSLREVVIYTPTVTGYIQGDKKPYWDKGLAFKRRLLSLYTRSTMYIIDGNPFRAESIMQSTEGQILLARRDELENQDGRRYRFYRNDCGGVSLAREEPGFLIMGEVGPLVEYDPLEDYRLWEVEKLVYLPRALGTDSEFLERCHRLRGAVRADRDLQVLVVDYYIGGGVKLLGKAPPLDPLIRYHDRRVELFVKQQSLGLVQADAPVAGENSRGGLFSASKRVLHGTPWASSLRGVKQQKHVGGGEAAAVNIPRDHPALLQQETNQLATDPPGLVPGRALGGF